MFLDNLQKENCCGCTACSQICGRNAITMRTDRKGFRYPGVNKDLCVECGLCEKVCPMMENYVGQDADPDIYAFQNKTEGILEQSSSGGMFSLIADWILSQGGVIYGAQFDDSFMVVHSRATTQEEVLKFRTSKYVESKFDEVFNTICEDLKSGNPVLVSGTPCQISAIRKYVSLRKADTTNLYLTDLVCHGVPSRKVWADYLDILKQKYMKPDDQITSVNMRSKKFSWDKQVIDIETSSGNLDIVNDDFSFNKFFLTLYCHRPSCFNCKYTSFKRPGDISLSDFWNADQARLAFNPDGGVNEVLLNTEKGVRLFEEISSAGHKQKINKRVAWQPHLEYSAKKPKNQSQFWRQYFSVDDKEVILRFYMKGSFMTRMIHQLTPVLRKTGLYTFAGSMYKRFVVKRNK